MEQASSYTHNDESLPQLSLSASQNAAGIIHVTICNLDHSNAADLTINLTGATPQSVSGRLVTAATMQSHNTFAQPDIVKAAELQGLTLAANRVQVQLPPMSVAVVAIN